jgi:hydrogenase/urease accessory protein HupE
LPMVFPAMMVVGAIMGMFVVPVLPVEVGIAVSVLVLGLCIALSVRAPVWAACLVVALFAVFHGYAHGKELHSAADPISYSAGFVLATGLGSPFEVHLTDHNGRASFIMPTSGMWLLNVIWTKVLPRIEETAFATVFSSLSFGFPSGQAMAHRSE